MKNILLSVPSSPQKLFFCLLAVLMISCVKVVDTLSGKHEYPHVKDLEGTWVVVSYTERETQLYDTLLSRLNYCTDDLTLTFSGDKKSFGKVNSLLLNESDCVYQGEYILEKGNLIDIKIQGTEHLLTYPRPLALFDHRHWRIQAYSNKVRLTLGCSVNGMLQELTMTKKE